jgi:hypothetical protein
MSTYTVLLGTRIKMHCYKVGMQKENVEMPESYAAIPKVDKEQIFLIPRVSCLNIVPRNLRPPTRALKMTPRPMPI